MLRLAEARINVHVAHGDIIPGRDLDRTSKPKKWLFVGRSACEAVSKGGCSMIGFQGVLSWRAVPFRWF